MNIRTQLEKIISQALHSAGASDNTPAVVKTSARPEFGDYQANGIMGAAKKLNINPRDLATKVLKILNSTVTYQLWSASWKSPALALSIYI